MSSNKNEQKINRLLEGFPFIELEVGFIKKSDEVLERSIPNYLGPEIEYYDKIIKKVYPLAGQPWSKASKLPPETFTDIFTDLKGDFAPEGMLALLMATGPARFLAGMAKARNKLAQENIAQALKPVLKNISIKELIELREACKETTDLGQFVTTKLKNIKDTTASETIKELAWRYGAKSLARGLQTAENEIISTELEELIAAEGKADHPGEILQKLRADLNKAREAAQTEAKER